MTFKIESEKSSMPDEYQEKDFGRLGLADILLNAGSVILNYSLFFSLQMRCVMVPIGQNAHHVRGL